MIFRCFTQSLRFSRFQRHGIVKRIVVDGLAGMTLSWLQVLGFDVVKALDIKVSPGANITQCLAKRISAIGMVKYCNLPLNVICKRDPDNGEYEYHHRDVKLWVKAWQNGEFIDKIGMVKTHACSLQTWP